VIKENIARGPNYIHPEKPSAVGSRNSLNRDNRNEYLESGLVVDEEIDKILNHVKSKLPPEVLDKMDIMGGVKDKLHNYYNQNLQNMQNRYLVTAEDELLKKYRDLIDREEFNQLNRYTPRAITEIMSKIGGEDKFNTSEIEKSIANIYGHLQGHIQHGVNELENKTNTILRQKDDVGSFIRKENAYAIVKCAFKNNILKPETVVDIKLAINVLDSELLIPIYHYQRPIQDLLKETISLHIHDQIDKKIEELNFNRVDEGQEELNQGEVLSEKLNELDNFLSLNDDKEDENSKRYDFVAKKFFDSLELIDTEDENASVRNHVEQIIDDENIRNKGFNKVVNSLTTILDSSKLGYQFIDNYKNARVCVVREYASIIKQELPDETFGLRLSYFSAEQLEGLRRSYDLQAEELKDEVEKVGKVIEKVQTEYNIQKGIRTYRDVSKEVLGQAKSKGFFSKSETPNGNDDHLWYEISFLKQSENGKSDKTYIDYNNDLKKKIQLMYKKLVNIFTNQYPPQRRILDKRIKFLEDAFQKFSTQINPHHTQQGLILEVDITSVKRKKTTMNSMSNVLNEFLVRVSSGFVEQTNDSPNALRSIIDEDDMNKKFTSVLQKMDESLEEVEA